MVNKVFLLVASLAVSVSLSSCSPSVGTPPLNKEQMVALLVDVHLAQSTVSRQMTIPPNEFQRFRYYKSVLDKHNISEAKFDSAVAWYARNVSEYKKVYAVVLDSLQKRRKNF